jgi:L-malate glycosyltransferase
MVSKEKYIINPMGMHSAKYGGLEKFLVLLARELKSHNIFLILIYNSEPASKEFSNDIIQAGGRIIVSHAMNPFKYFFTFIKLFVKFKPVLVHAHFQFYYSVVFARLMGCRRIFITLHGMTIDERLNCIVDTRKLKFSTRVLRRVVNRFSSRIITVSNAVSKQYTLLFPQVENKIETHYLGTFPNNNLPEQIRRNYNFKSEKVIIGTIGFNSPVKGLDILMDAMVMLKDEKNCHNFIVCQIGIDPKDPLNRIYFDESKRKGLDELMLWMGIRNDVPELLPGMDIYCQPSRSEALGLAIMEAGMAGLPVVGSDVGGIPEIVHHGVNGFLFETGNAKELADYLYRLIKDPGLRKNMGKKSIELVSGNFNIVAQAEELCVRYLNELHLE